MEPSLFDDVGDAVRGLLTPDLGEPHLRAHRYGIKVWFRTVKPTREHYEAQVVGARDWPGARVLALEVGFHCEHPKESDNDAVTARLTKTEKRWRRDIGKEAEIAPRQNPSHRAYRNPSSAARRGCTAIEMPRYVDPQTR